MARKLRSLVVLATAATLASPALATSATAAERGSVPATEISMSWQGSVGQRTITDSLFGDVIAVPGDADASILRVRNDGPTDGILTVSIARAEAWSDRDDPSWSDDGFFDDLRINDMPAADIVGGTTRVLSTDLARGAFVDVPFWYEFPAEATTGNSAQVGERRFSFDVELRITGDTGEPSPPTVPGEPAAPSEPAPGEPTPPSTEDDAGQQDDGDDVWGKTASTGGAALPNDRAWLLAGAGGLVLVALAAARAVRGSRKDEP